MSQIQIKIGKVSVIKIGWNVGLIVIMELNLYKIIRVLLKAWAKKLFLLGMIKCKNLVMKKIKSYKKKLFYKNWEDSSF